MYTESVPATGIHPKALFCTTLALPCCAIALVFFPNRLGIHLRRAPLFASLRTRLVQKLNTVYMIADHPTKELSVLSYIDQNSDATQRELSEHIGVSLGSINILVKRMVRKGLIKIERLQPNSVRYFLTPQGLASKIERTYAYIVRTYQEIGLFRVRITNTIKPLVKKDTHLIFFGPNDDFSYLLKEIVEEEFPALKKQFVSPERLSALLPRLKPNTLFITWENEADRILEEQKIEAVNILTGISVIESRKDNQTNEQ